MNINELFKEFPKEAISWRAQSVTADGTKAMALAYIDARDVMDRLDMVCGAENWQDRYEFHGARTVCYLSIRIAGEWITKADGAGDSDVEAEKGAISDALKRAAVKWGIGRYLYNLKSPWVPCESYEKGGKKHWKKWAGDPWDYVKAPKPSTAPQQPQQSEKDTEATVNLWSELTSLTTLSGLSSFWKDNYDTILGMSKANKEKFTAEKDMLKSKFGSASDTVKDIQDTFGGAKVVNETFRELHNLEAGE